MRSTVTSSAVTNFGTVVLIDPDAPGGPTYTLIASGGTRGDYASPDVTNGTLFIDTADIVYRLACGPDCGIGVAPPPIDAVPEPETYALMLAGLAAMGAVARRRRQPLPERQPSPSVNGPACG